MTQHSPLSLLLASPAVRQHLTKAGKELALALRAVLGGVESQVRKGALEGSYPYLQTALANLTATAERLAAGLGWPTEVPQAKSRRARTSKRAKGTK